MRHVEFSGAFWQVAAEGLHCVDDFLMVVAAGLLVQVVAVKGNALFLLLALVPAALDAPDISPFGGGRFVDAEEVVCGGDPLVDPSR